TRCTRRRPSFGAGEAEGRASPAARPFSIRTGGHQRASYRELLTQPPERRAASAHPGELCREGSLEGASTTGTPSAARASALTASRTHRGTTCGAGLTPSSGIVKPLSFAWATSRQNGLASTPTS